MDLFAFCFTYISIGVKFGSKISTDDHTLAKHNIENEKFSYRFVKHEKM